MFVFWKQNILICLSQLSDSFFYQETLKYVFIPKWEEGENWNGKLSLSQLTPTGGNSWHSPWAPAEAVVSNLRLSWYKNIVKILMKLNKVAHHITFPYKWFIHMIVKCQCIKNKNINHKRHHLILMSSRGKNQFWKIWSTKRYQI